MKQNTLGQTDLKVTDLCLGTMTWGTQTSEADAHRQIETALAAGINFIDTAEMYPVTPVRSETLGLTETIIGNWIARTGRRGDFVLATKIAGGNRGVCRNGEAISGPVIQREIDNTLRRLRTDVIDLYQLHWPNRGSYAFRQNWDYAPHKQDRADTLAHMADVLTELARQIAAGKIRYVGLSNESAWGTLNWLKVADAVGGPRIQSIQNEYSLMHRLFDTDMAEVSANEQIGLMAYSPLASGLLTGKYQDGGNPAGSRRNFSEDLGGRFTDRALTAVAAYHAIAAKHGLDPVQMALAFCRSRPFMTSAILGATTQTQLEHILAGRDLVLTTEVLTDLNVVHRAHPMPF